MPGMGFGFGFGFHRRASGSGASASEQLLTLATAAGAEAVYDPDNDETATLRSDGSDLWYSAISDGLGNREDLVQATASAQPKQTTLSTGRRVAFYEGGTSKEMIADFAAGIAQPNTVLMVAREANATTSGRILDGTSVTSGRQILGADSNEWAIWAGTFIRGSTGVGQNFNILHGNYNGASSEMFVGGASVASGDAGANGFGGVQVITGKGGERGPIIVFTGLKTNAELSDIRDHLNANWPIGEAA